MDLSIVIPLINERESLPELTARLHQVLGAMGVKYEVLLIDDGSTDGSWDEIERLHEADGRVKGIKLGRNYGKSPALNEGFQAAQGNVVVTMDADLQDDPDEVPELYRMITQDGFDLVSGWKKKRYDPLSKTIPTTSRRGRICARRWRSTRAWGRPRRPRARRSPTWSTSSGRRAARTLMTWMTK